jgi:hypothetical protein
VFAKFFLMQKLIFPLLISIIALASCHKDPEQVLPDFPWDCDYDIGTYEILPSSYAAIPYEEKQNVVFMDSLENVASFQITSKEKNHLQSKMSIYDPQNPNLIFNYCYYEDAKEYILTNDSLGLRINMNLVAEPFHPTPQSRLVGDRLYMTVYKKSFFNEYGIIGVFNTTIDQRTSHVASGNSTLDSLNCFGKSFYQVENQPLFLDFTCSIFYTASDGVVIFNDIDGKRWRFERFE